MPESVQFVRKEREHLALLHQRLDLLQGDHPERRGDPNFPPGEAAALAWAVAVVERIAEPVDVRLARHERKMRGFEARLGRLEADFEEEA